MLTKINSNSPSLVIQHQQRLSQGRLETALSRLASGLRINSAQDDTAGQGVANRMTARIHGFAQAQRNANDGISLAQTAEGALDQINHNLLHIRRLTVQALNDTNSAGDLNSIQSEIAARLDEIDRISMQSQFNGISLLGEDASTIRIQVGSQDNDTIALGLETINSSLLGLAGFNITGKAMDISASMADASTLLDKGYIAGTTDLNGVTPYAVSGDVNPQASISDVLSRATRGTRYDPYSEGGYASPGAAGQQDYYFSPTDAAFFKTRAGVDGYTGNITSLGEVKLVYDEARKLYIREQALDGAIKYYAVDSTMVDEGGVVKANLPELSLPYKTGPLVGEKELEGHDSIGGSTYFVVLDDTPPSTHEEIATAFDTAGYHDANVIIIDGTHYHVETDGSIIEKGSGKTVYVDGEGALTTDFSSGVSYYELDDGSINTQPDGSGETLHITSEGAWYWVAEQAAEQPLALLDSAIGYIDERRSALGAVQNRLATAIETVRFQQASLHSARSRIEDADYAQEASQLIKEKILQEAGKAILAQANNRPRSVLTLLQ